MNINIAQPIIGQDEIDAVTRVMKSGVLAQGPEVFEFEKEFAQYIGVKHAIATSNGSTALLVALMALLEQNKAAGITGRNEVITTPFTFLASASSIILAGLVPVFIDIDPDTFCMDVNQLERAISEKTVAIMPVQLYGNVCDMDTIADISSRYGVPVIEDCAQSHGAKYNGKVSGSFGLAGCFSFYPTKNMTTGEGGIITTDNDDIAIKCRLIRAHGMSAPYQYDYLGFNYRMTSIGAAIGRVQLSKLHHWNSLRQRNASLYNNLLPSEMVPVVSPKVEHVYHQYTIKCSDPAGLKAFLLQKGIGSGVYYPAPLYDFPIMQQYKASCLITEQIAKCVLSIPVHPLVTEDQIKMIAEAINEWKTE